jgi:hypothetical protein
MTLGELIDSAMESADSPHSNGKFYTLEQVRAMQLTVMADGHRPYRLVLGVYPSADERTIIVDME